MTHILEHVKPWAPGVLGKSEKTDYTQSPKQGDTQAPYGVLLEAQAGSRLEVCGQGSETACHMRLGPHPGPRASMEGRLGARAVRSLHPSCGRGP